jgi:hypothetical protein
MKDRQNVLLARIAAQLGALDQESKAVVANARQQALDEATALLKEMMTAQILAAALRYMEGGEVPVLSQRPAPLSGSEERSAAIPAVCGEDEERQRLRQEMEAIQAQIAENEMRLRETKASSPGPEIEAAATPTALEGPYSADATGSAYYVYVYGLWAKDGQETSYELAPAGVDPHFPVYTLPCDHLEAIVSRVSVEQFNEDSLQARLADADWLAATLQAHQQVLEAACAGDSAARRAVLPMRFCTLYHSEDRVRQMVSQCADECLATLERLNDAQEWGVKAYCDLTLLSPQIEAGSARMAELHAETRQKSAGAAYFAQKKLQDTLSEEMERFCDQCAQESHDRLSAIAREHLLRSPQSQEVTERNEEMILNGAYLVADGDLDAFRSVLDALGGEFADHGIAYELTGPWPAYSFVTIEGDQEHP